MIIFPKEVVPLLKGHIFYSSNFWICIQCRRLVLNYFPVCQLNISWIILQQLHLTTSNSFFNSQILDYKKEEVWLLKSISNVEEPFGTWTCVKSPKKSEWRSIPWRGITFTSHVQQILWFPRSPLYFARSSHLPKEQTATDRRRVPMMIVWNKQQQ